MDELSELRYAVYNLVTADWIKRTDEEWYAELWKLLDPVIDARAERQLAAAQTVMPNWTSPDDSDGDTHDYEPDNERRPSPMQTDPPCRTCGQSRRDCER